MKSLSKSKASKYKVLIGWGLVIYCTTKNDVDEIIWIYGKDKVLVEKL